SPAPGGPQARSKLRRLVSAHLLTFAVAYALALGWAVNTAYAQPPAHGAAVEGAARLTGGMSVGDGLAILGIALATAISVLGAGYAVAIVGAAALGAVTE